MTTTVNLYIDTDHVGGTQVGTKDNPYHSVVEVETNYNTGPQNDLVGNDEIIIAHCKGNAIDEFNGAVSFPTSWGWTTSPSNYLEITADKTGDWAGRHTGVAGTGYHVRSNNSSTFTSVTISNVRFTGLEVSSVADSSVAINIGGSEGNGEIYVRECICHGVWGFTGVPLYVSGQVTDTAYVYNNIVYDGVNNAYSGIIFVSSIGNAYIYNNTIDNSFGFGIRTTALDTIAINNIVQNSRLVSYYGTYDTENSGFNISDDSDTTGSATDITNTTINFTNPSNNDYHLSPVDVEAIDQGQDLRADEFLPFDTDIDGGTRGASWDIGADQYDSPSSSSSSSESSSSSSQSSSSSSQSSSSKSSSSSSLSSSSESPESSESSESSSSSETPQVRLLIETVGNEKKFFTIEEDGVVKLISTIVS